MYELEDIIVMRGMGYTYAEIAEVTNIKKTSVGKFLSRAIDRCAQLMER